MTLALYDMDRTLTDRPSWLYWLMFWARREAPWRLLLLPLLPLLLLAYPLRLLDRGGLKQAMQALFMGRRVPAARVAARADEFAARFGAAHERADALAQLAADRALGLTPVLVTASPHFYVDALARRWGIATVIATRNCRDGDWLTPRLDGANCHGAEKIVRLQAAFGPALGQVAAAYSDHVSDLPLLELARAPVAVTPSRALRRIARARGWAIRDWC